MASVCLSPAAQAASLFDAIGAIFGADPEPPRAYQPRQRGWYDEGEALDVTVRPRRHQPRRERRVIRKEKPVSVPAANLDPAKNPNWYLEDPTLRRGDIVVLAGEVLVFEGSGRGPHAREDFTSLDRSRLSKAERERVGAMAGLPPVPAPLAGARNKTATVADER
ncbi:hypothetical protein [Enterovirga aerilata]|uniref:Uncharacterized protein n=1 Tax=Enterovirga aerilata TaxID=2730920 RepID=A0A849I8L3_9HYPH|nr:hypothetical protein [Enterovirga sp. DB1703]NNM72410.1 hypothetical protein [Enterovirga sp. DB1703]